MRPSSYSRNLTTRVIDPTEDMRVKERRYRYPKRRRQNFYIALGCFAVAMIAAIAAWGQPVPDKEGNIWLPGGIHVHEPTPTPNTTAPFHWPPYAGTYVIEPQTGTNGYDLFSEPPEVHFRCTKLRDNRYRFEAMDDLNAPRVEITCTNCSCSTEEK